MDFFIALAPSLARVALLELQLQMGSIYAVIVAMYLDLFINAEELFAVEPDELL